MVAPAQRKATGTRTLPMKRRGIRFFGKGDGVSTDHFESRSELDRNMLGNDG